MLLSIVLAVVAAQVIGMFWYSKAGFGKKWMELTGMKEPDPSQKCKGMMKSMLICLLLTIIAASVIWGVMDKYGLQVQCIMALWLALAFPVYASAALWEKKSWKLVWLNSACSFIVTLVMATIIRSMM